MTMSETTDLVRSRRRGWSLEQPFYVDPLYFQLDLDRVFRTGWLFAGHTCQIKEPGDYFCYDIAQDSLIIIRGNDGKVRALFNVCRHRGSLICKAVKGHVKRLVCPYHQWTYDTDGSLIRNTWMPADFVNDDFNLKQAHVKTVAGLIYVSLAPVAPEFAPQDDLKGLLEFHGLENAKVAYSETYDIAANWKLVIENQRECYHCPAKHKGYAKIQFDTDVDNSENQSEIEARWDESREKWAAMGLDVSLADHRYAMKRSWWRVNRTPFRKGCVSETVDGQPVAPLMGKFTDPDAGNARANTYPNFWLHGSSDHVHTMRVTPIDENTTRIQADWLVNETAEEGVDYSVERVIAFSKRVNEEDHEIAEDQAKGVMSSRYQPGPYSPVKEKLVEHFVAWYIEQIDQISP